MANISTYATKTTPVGADKVPGTDSADGTTKNFTVAALTPYIVGASAESTLVNSEVLARFVCPVALSIPANLGGSSGSAMVAPAATATINIQKRVSGATSYSVVASFNFTTGMLPRPANLSTQAAVSFAAGDEVTIIGPASADTLLAQWSFTLVMILA